MCVLLGYGADAICPYLVFEMAKSLRQEGVLDSSFTDKVVFEVNIRKFVGQRKKRGKEISKNLLTISKFYSVVELFGSHGQRYIESDGQNGHINVAIVQRCSDLRSYWFGRRGDQSML